jgi:hypothetical protein
VEKLRKVGSIPKEFFLFSPIRTNFGGARVTNKEASDRLIILGILAKIRGIIV